MSLFIIIIVIISIPMSTIMIIVPSLITIPTITRELESDLHFFFKHPKA